MSDIAEQVIKIVTEHLGTNPGEVTPDSSFIDDLGADSLDVVELVMAFEDEFGITISDPDAERLGLVRDAIDYVVAARAESRARD